MSLIREVLVRFDVSDHRVMGVLLRHHLKAESVLGELLKRDPKYLPSLYFGFYARCNGRLREGEEEIVRIMSFAKV